MAILIVAEHDHVSLSDQTAKALSAAREIGGDIHILVAGKNANLPQTPLQSSTVSPRCSTPKATNTPTGLPSRSQTSLSRLPVLTTR
jgi:electron transfer flavoprotein alpha subunit